MFYCEILSGLWISDIDVMYSKEFLKDNHIDIIMNCTIHYDFPEIDIEKHRLPFSEMMNERDIQMIQDNIDKIVHFINKEIETKNILLCCYNGKSISPLLVALYIKKFSTLSTKNIIESLKTKHSDINLPIDLDSIL